MNVSSMQSINKNINEPSYMYCYNVYMHEIEMREHGDHGAGDIDV